MIKSKKVIAFLVMCMMMITSIAPAQGIEFNDVSGNYQEAIDVLTSLEVINGYGDGTYKPNNTITRAELATLLVKALGYEKVVGSIQGQLTFSDTQNHWANGWVTIASGLDLVKGDGDGTFRPDDTVSYDEAYTMIVRALGYRDEVLTGSWPLNYRIKAHELDLADGVKSLTLGADRGGVAQILYNSLEVPTVTFVNGRLETEYQKDGKTPKMLLDRVAKYNAEFVVTPSVLDKDSKDYAGNKVDLSDYMYQTLIVYENNDNEVIYVRESKSLVVEGTLDKADTDYIYIKGEGSKSEKVVISEDVKAFFNGAEIDDFDMRDIEDENAISEYEKIVIVAEDKNNNNDIDRDTEIVGIVLVQQTEAFVVEEVYNEKRARLDDIYLPTDKDGDIDLDNVLVMGAATKLDDIKIGDVVVSYESEDGEFVKILVTRGSIAEGTIKRLSESTAKVTINTKEYEVNKLSAEVYNISNKTLNIYLGDEGKFMLDHNSKVVGFAVNSVARGNYGIVIGIADGTTEAGRFNSQTIDEYASIKIATTNGRTVIYDIHLVLEEDGAIDESAVYNKDNESREYDLLYTQNNIIKFKSEALSDLEKGQIIQYNVNSKGDIDAITLLREETLTDVRTSSSAFDLASNAVIFKNDGTSYPVVKESYLESRVTGYGYYNSKDEIEVFVVTETSIGLEADEVVIAYLASTSNIAKGYDEDDKVVQIPTLVVRGEEEEYYTSENNMFTTAGVYEIEIEDGIIVKATKKTPLVAKVVDKDNRNDMLELSVDGKTTYYYLAESVNMIEIDGRYFEEIDLYDISVGDIINIVIVDRELGYVAIGDIDIPEYSVNYSVVSGNGTLTSTKASGSYVDVYTNTTFTATPSAGYQIKEWKVNGTVKVITGNVLTMSIESDTLVTVEFEAIPPTTYTVNYSVINATGGAISTTVASGSQVAEGNELVFTLVPEEGQEVKEAVVNDIAVEVVDNSFTVTVTGATTVTVEYQAIPVTMHTVTYSVVNETGGLIETTVVSGSEVAEGTELVFTITPEEGQAVKDVLVNTVSTEVIENSFSVVVSAATEVTVEFQSVFTVDYSVVNEIGGTLVATIETEPEVTSEVATASEVAEGTEVTFTATADVGYEIKEWLVNGVITVVVGNELVQIVNENTVVTVEYQPVI